MDNSKKLLQYFKSGDLAQGEALWYSMIAKNVDVFEELELAAQELLKKRQSRKLQELLKATVNHFLKVKKSKLLLKAIQLFALYNPDDRTAVYIQEYGNAFLARYGKKRPYLNDWMTRLVDPTITIEKWIDILSKIVLFSVGNVVKHTNGWGVGKVLAIHSETMEITVDLEQQRNHRMNILAAAESLTPLEEDDFEVFLKYKQEILRQEAENEPLKLIHRLMKFNMDPVTSREIKIYLCPNIVTDTQWSKWWAKVRKLMIEDPYIEVSGKGQAKYSIREVPMDWEQEILERFKEVEGDDRISYILEYTKNTTRGDNVPFFVDLLDKMSQTYMEKNEPGRAAECYLIIEMCQEKMEEKYTPTLTLDDIATNNGALIYHQLTLNALSQQTLDILLKYEPNWQENIGAIFCQTTDLGRDVLYRHLEKENLVDELLPIIYKTAAHEALIVPDAYIWLARFIFLNKFQKHKCIPSMVECFQTLISMGSTLKSLRKTDATKKINRLLTTSLTKKIIAQLNEKNGLALWEVIDRASFVLENFRKEFHLHLFDKFPNLFKKQDPLFGTLRGKRKKEMELQELITRKMEENTKAIGEALSFGDISENAELDAARELQIQMAQKAKSMQSDIGRFVEINLQEVDIDRVSIGTKVTLEKDKQQVTYIILGPWDADLEQGIISYLSEIAQRIMDLPSQSKVKLPDGEYVIVKIERLDEDAIRHFS